MSRTIEAFIEDTIREIEISDDILNNEDVIRIQEILNSDKEE